MILDVHSNKATLYFFRAAAIDGKGHNFRFLRQQSEQT